MISRKEFLKRAGYITAGSLVPGLTGQHFIRKLTPPDISILYTNDTHARLDPFPKNSTEFAGLGGIARRASLVKKVRAQQKNVLLLDAGDVFQGTPWFDVYGGSVDLKLMTEMKYDAMAVGNHEFDRGPDGFAEAAQKAGFPILAANYNVEGTPMNPYVQRYLVREMDGFRVGIFGLGIQLEGVVSKELYGDVVYRNPQIWANGLVRSLREFHMCDYVICLSHLGYKYESNRIDDLTLAKNVSGIDLIIGGHTHTFLDVPTAVTNPDGDTTFVTQMGHSGVRIGRADLRFTDQTRKPEVDFQYYTIGEPIG